MAAISAPARRRCSTICCATPAGAAWTLKLDGEIGSIETGKRADFAVLEADPIEVAPEALKDVGVWGVVADGRPVAA